MAITAAAAAADVLDRLARLDGSALAQVLLQHGPAIGTVLRPALTHLAHTQLQASVLPVSSREGDDADELRSQAACLRNLATVLERVLGRGDPSLARVLLPGTPTLVDLAVAIGTLQRADHAASAGAVTTLRRALRALVDPHLAVEILAAVHAGLSSAVVQPFHAQQLRTKSASAGTILADIQKRTRMLALLLRAMPPPAAAAAATATSSSASAGAGAGAGGTARKQGGHGKPADAFTAVLAQLAQDLAAVHDAVLPALSKREDDVRSGGADVAAAAAARTHTRDAALSLLLLFRPAAAKAGFPSLSSSVSLASIVAQLAPPPPSSPSAASSSGEGGAAEEPALIDVLRARFLADSGGAWDELMVVLKKHAANRALTPGRSLDLISPPEALLSALLAQQQQQQQHVHQQGRAGRNDGQNTVRASKRKGKGKGKGSGPRAQGTPSGPPVDPTVLATVQSILPHLDTPALATRLRRPKYAGKSAEQIIDLLLESSSDGEEDASGRGDGPESASAPASEEEEEEGGEEEGSGGGVGDEEEAEPYEPPAPIVRAPRRANIFDDEGPLDLSKFRYKPDMPSLDVDASGGGGGSGAGTPSRAGTSASAALNSIPDALKASVLARVAAQQREEAEEHEADAEFEDWALLGAAGRRRRQRGGAVREAGFEEELEEEDAQEEDRDYIARNGDGLDWIGRRGMTTSLAAASSAPTGAGGKGQSAVVGVVSSVPSAREWRRKFEDESDGEEDEEPDAEDDEPDANAGGGPSTARPVPAAAASSSRPSGSGTGTSASAASERVAERVLTRYYAQHGAALFARDPALRKGNHPLGLVRRQLLAELERETGKSWDAGLVESWGTMFERNPRKDRLLAKSTDLLGPNPNHRPAAGAEGGGGGDGDGRAQRQFGPDRGRGGRVLRGGGGGSRGGGQRGGGGGPGGSGGGSGPGSASGSGSGTGPGKGQHSGSNRAARQKEKRGSSARFRGRGGGMARSGAFPAGVGE